MQHTGWLRRSSTRAFPEQRLVIRNLAYDGDEIDPAKRLRSADFGTPDQWLSGAARSESRGAQTKDFVRENRFELANTRADVIFAFFGGQRIPRPAPPGSMPSSRRSGSSSTTRWGRNTTASLGGRAW
jgi:hypothetical protein